MLLGYDREEKLPQRSYDLEGIIIYYLTLPRNSLLTHLIITADDTTGLVLGLILSNLQWCKGDGWLPDSCWGNILPSQCIEQWLRIHHSHVQSFGIMHGFVTCNRVWEPSKRINNNKSLNKQASKQTNKQSNKQPQRFWKEDRRIPEDTLQPT